MTAEVPLIPQQVRTPVTRRCENWIKSYMRYSAFSEAPDKFHFWTAVSVIAGALRRHTWMDMGYFQWTPNFYIVFVAPPGIVSKSTTANIGMSLLREVDGVKFGPDAVTWQKLAQSLAESKELFSLPGEEAYHTMSALTIVSSEFGTFLNPNDREMVDVLVSLWDGQIGAWRKATKTMGDDEVQNPWINIIACTTPAWIAGNFPEYLIGGGFTSRTIFIYADQKRQLVAYPKHRMPADIAKQRDALVHDLEIIANQLFGEYELSPKAQAWGERWYENHYRHKPAHLTDERFGGYLARKQTHIHKLAMVLSAAYSDAMVLDEADLSAANEIVTSLEHDMPKVFSQIGRTSEDRQTVDLVAYINRVGRVDRVDLFRKTFNSTNYKGFEIALQNAVAAGNIQPIQIGPVMYYESTRAGSLGNAPETPTTSPETGADGTNSEDG